MGVEHLEDAALAELVGHFGGAQRLFGLSQQALLEEGHLRGGHLVALIRAVEGRENLDLAGLRGRGRLLQSSGGLGNRPLALVPDGQRQGHPDSIGGARHVDLAA